MDETEHGSAEARGSRNSRRNRVLPHRRHKPKRIAVRLLSRSSELADPPPAEQGRNNDAATRDQRRHRLFLVHDGSLRPKIILSQEEEVTDRKRAQAYRARMAFILRSASIT